MSTALVTGGSRGIGRAVAVRFAQAGYDVAFCYSKDEKGARETADLIRAAGKAPLVYRADVSDEKSVREMMESVFSLEILVNNAGVALYKEIAETTLEEWKDLFSVNVEGAFLCTRYAAEKMKKRGGGSIVNVASVWGETGGSCEAAYSASKAALIGFTKAAAKELAPCGIRVNCVSAGIVHTDMNAHLNRDELEDFLSQIPVKRMGTCEEIAESVLFLAQSRYITGEILRVNGGLLV